MIKKLGLGGYMKKKSGRGNQGKLDDKIYSAFISTLMEQDEEEEKDCQRCGKKEENLEVKLHMTNKTMVRQRLL